MVRREAGGIRHRTVCQRGDFRKEGLPERDCVSGRGLFRRREVQPSACAAAIDGKLQEAGVSLTPDPKNAGEIAFTYPDGYFSRK